MRAVTTREKGLFRRKEHDIIVIGFFIYKISYCISGISS